MLKQSETDLLARALSAGNLVAAIGTQMMCECQRDTQCQMCVAYNEWQAVSDDISEHLLDVEYQEAEREQREAGEFFHRENQGPAESHLETKLENVRSGLSRTVESLLVENEALRRQSSRWYKIAERYYLGDREADGQFQRELGERS